MLDNFAGRGIDAGNIGDEDGLSRREFARAVCGRSDVSAKRVKCCYALTCGKNKVFAVLQCFTD